MTSLILTADLLVRFYVRLDSRKIEKVFWWTLKDGGERQFDQADMVGLVRADRLPLSKPQQRVQTTPAAMLVGGSC